MKNSLIPLILLILISCLEPLENNVFIPADRRTIVGRIVAGNFSSEIEVRGISSESKLEIIKENGDT